MRHDESYKYLSTCRIFKSADTPAGDRVDGSDEIRLIE